MNQKSALNLLTGWLALGCPTSPTTAAPPPETAPADAGAIVFASDRDGDFEIYRMNPDGGDWVQLTDNAGEDTRPSCSPDGMRIALISDRNGSAALFVMNADGTNPTKLVEDAGEASSATWSPDGKRIACDFRIGRQFTIYVLDADGGNQQKIADDAMGPAWSPDGTAIAFSRGNMPVLYQMNPDGTNVRRLLKDDPNDILPDLNAIWSPDGTMIAYTAVKGAVQRAGKDQLQYEIRIISDDGEQNKSVLTVSGMATCWSADGAQLVYAVGTRESMDLYVMNRDGSNAKRLTTEPGREHWASWLAPKRK